jgi:hypothetical protein
MDTKPIQMADGSYFAPGPNAVMKDAAAAYMQKAGFTYNPPTNYVKVDPAYGAKVAAEFEKMEHNPDDPMVKASYDALKNETVAQWNAIKAADPGLKVDWISPGQKDPYAANNLESDVRRAQQDVSDNNHWWGYPTDLGFGTDAKARVGNPMLADAGITIGGHKCCYNDVFRLVHDMMAHVAEGVGFRADGEENAWRIHRAMFSPLAQGALTSETRGQGNWVNWGPYGRQNRSANSVDTHYAPQKIGLMPAWTWKDNYHEN